MERDLRELEKAGIENIMALRGDLPRDVLDYKSPKSGFSYASELISYIRKAGFSFSIGAACYPEVHVEASSAERRSQKPKKKGKCRG